MTRDRTADDADHPPGITSRVGEGRSDKATAPKRADAVVGPLGAVCQSHRNPRSFPLPRHYHGESVVGARRVP